MISTRGRYALRMIVDLAENQKDGYVSLKEIAERQSISKKYLEQIIPVLTRSGMLLTSRGFQGGYRLAKPAAEYTVGEIVRATEGSIAPVACLEDKVNECPRQGECSTLFVWDGLYHMVTEYLEGITVQDILDRKMSKNGNDYII